MTITIGTQISRVTFSGKDKLFYPDIEEDFRDYFSCPNDKAIQYQRMMMRKGKRISVNERKYFVNAAGEFATGFLSLVPTLLERYGWKVDVRIEDERKNVAQFVSVHTSCPRFELAPHQVRMVGDLNNYLDIAGNKIYFPRGIWRVAPNGGKTAASYCAVESFHKAKALFLVDTQELFNQTIAFFEECYGVGNVGKIGRVKSKYVYDVGHKIDVAMVKTLYSKAEKSMEVVAFLANNYDILIVDECHTTASGQGAKIIQMVNAGVRLFMSGSPFKKDDKYAGCKLLGMSGPKITDIPRAELVELGHSLAAKVKIFYNGPYEVTPYDYPGQVKQVITRSVRRAAMVAKLIANRKDKTIIINFEEKLHGYFMYDYFIKKYPELAKYAAIVYGDHPDRKDILQKFADQEIRFLFTSEILRQGVNIAHIRCIIFAQGGKSPVDMTQFPGRIERLDGINTSYELLDFWDDCSTLSKHSRLRIRFYQKEKMNLEFKYEATNAGTPKMNSHDD